MKLIEPDGNVEQISYERRSQAHSSTCLPQVRKKMLTAIGLNVNLRRMASVKQNAFSNNKTLIRLLFKNLFIFGFSRSVRRGKAGLQSTLPVNRRGSSAAWRAVRGPGSLYSRAIRHNTA